MVTEREGKEMKAFLTALGSSELKIGSRQENETELSGRAPGIGLWDALGLGVVFAVGCVTGLQASVSTISAAGQPRIDSFKRRPPANVSSDAPIVTACRGRGHVERGRHAGIHHRRLLRIGRPDRTLEVRNRVVEAARDPGVLEGTAQQQPSM